MQVDLVLPAENTELLKLADQIKQSDLYTVTTYIKQAPETNRGDILVFISDNLIQLSQLEYPAIFGVYIDKSLYRNNQKPNFTAVYSQQAFIRQLKLIQILSNNKPTIVGFPFFNSEYRDRVKKIEAKFPTLDIRYEAVTDEDQNRKINALIQEVDYLLSSAEVEIYNQKTIRSLLLSSYRHRTKVIGPNISFVKAGALATVSSNSQQYAATVVQILEKYLQDKVLPEATYPSEYSIKINKNVAFSLGVGELDEQEILEEMGSEK
ncbi:hypothetical protein IB286_01210 [Spongiibacter sp. KMU-158]|uniref:ABC transporter substrate-binding protein n=1 Tax=Spongiibacter pelagi TaxID=2760804 RepID=A0A927C139_9GAMM|nr:hypothetical protein [Spongiibacter pelagi]MBD2857605.1 hypothetical protein [Spongiibacter pelagi]